MMIPREDEVALLWREFAEATRVQDENVRRIEELENQLEILGAFFEIALKDREPNEPAN